MGVDLFTHMWRSHLGMVRFAMSSGPVHIPKCMMIYDVLLDPNEKVPFLSRISRYIPNSRGNSSSDLQNITHIFPFVIFFFCQGGFWWWGFVMLGWKRILWCGGTPACNWEKGKWEGKCFWLLNMDSGMKLGNLEMIVESEMQKE